MNKDNPTEASHADDKKKTLKERARLLAREPGKKDAGETLEILGFSLAHERYGIETSFIREVYPLKEYTPLPCTPAFVFGLINVRGQVLSIIDMRKFFELPEKGISDLNKVIILHNESMEFGILADEIIGVKTIPLRQLQITLPTLTDIREKYLKGVTQDQMVVLDAAKLLIDKNMIVHEEV
jgi:purine-binding chemotaxis protein CheW